MLMYWISEIYLIYLIYKKNPFRYSTIVIQKVDKYVELLILGRKIYAQKYGTPQVC
jgi:hypothetical protein